MMMTLLLELAENTYITYNHATDNNQMFSAIINEEKQVISVDSRSKVKDYKIVDIVLFLFER